MITLKLKIKNINNIDFINNKINNYSYAYRKLFNNLTSIENDKTIKKNFCKKYELDSYDYLSLLQEIKTKRSQVKTLKDSLISQEKNILNRLKTETNKHKIYKLNKKLKSINDNLSKNIVFGNKVILQKLSFLNNDKINNQIKINELKNQYKEGRILPLFLCGEEYQNSNRKINFYLNDKHVIYKPNKNTKVKIAFYANDNYQKKLNQLQNSLGTLPISIKISKDYIYLIYDEEKLNSFHLDIKNRDKEIKDKPKELIKEIYKKFYKEQENRKTKNKIQKRYCGIDLNPENIGISIIDKNNNSLKEIYKCNFDLSLLNTSLKLSSTNPIQIKQNNKRKHEIKEIWKNIFNLLKHFKVSHLIIEELNFKKETINDNSSIANKKTKNLWHRTLTTNLINKHCNENGILIIEINPAYSSFIGNIKHNYIDPINSSLEICRRGIYKYTKNSFYPIINKTDIDTMSNLIKNQVRDVQYQNILINNLSSLDNNWIKTYQTFRDTGLKYRRTLSESTPNNVFSMNNIKSKVKLYNFI